MVRESKEIKCPHCDKETKIEFYDENTTGNCYRCDHCKEGFYYDWRKNLLI